MWHFMSNYIQGKSLAKFWKHHIIFKMRQVVMWKQLFFKYIWYTYYSDALFNIKIKSNGYIYGM